MLEIRLKIGALIICVAWCMSMVAQQPSGPIKHVQLISQEESEQLAASPAMPTSGSRADQKKSVILDIAAENGPKLNVLAPKSNRVSNPIAIHIQFLPKAVPVNWASLRVHVQRWVLGAYHGNLDLTPRIQEYLVTDGVDIPSQDMPKGRYRLVLDIMDTSGGKTQGAVVLDVQ